MKYQAILFDMDGTLLDTLTDMQAAVNHILEKYGCPTRTLEEVRRFVGNGAGPLIHRALPQGVDPDREAEILADYRAYYQAHNCVETRPYDGIGPLLERLRREGVRTAVVSNKPDQTTRTLAARFFPELDGAMGQREGIAPKPAPDMVRAALARLHAAPEETLYVGDSEVDVDTARNAGLDMIGVAWGFRGRAALEAAGAPLVADTPAQLLDMLLFAVLAQLELLHALQHGAEQRLVRQGLQREVAVAHHQLHPGGVVGGALQPVVGVIAQEQGTATGKVQAVGGHADDAVV